jgi:hypothetical protein
MHLVDGLLADLLQDVRFLRVYTGKNAQVVTNLQQICSNTVPTTCQQHVFAPLVPSLFVNGLRLAATCCKIVELNRLVTSNNLLSSCNSTSCE